MEHKPTVTELQQQFLTVAQQIRETDRAQEKTTTEDEAWRLSGVSVKLWAELRNILYAWRKVEDER